ncbi:MAG TPA: hypothetical protein VLX90_20440 [Steroidobacteraceae bacterium]|nr:hypothetical protein [Steroidobacteraceae bacterium]
MSDSNPYEAPNARVDDPVDRRFRWKAVLLGAGTDLGGTVVASIVLFIVFAALLTPSEGPAESATERLQQSWPFLMTSTIVGGAFTVLGGYVAGRLARHAFLKHALGAGVISFVVGILLPGSDESPYSGLLSLVAYTCHFPLALLGGWFAARWADTHSPANSSKASSF